MTKEMIYRDGQTFRYLVNGEWAVSSSGKTVSIKSAIDDAELGRVQAITPKEVDGVFAAAKTAQKEWWRSTTANDRAELLEKGAENLLEHTDELAELLVLEIGKTKKEARDEVVRTADFINYTAEEARRVYGETVIGDALPGGSQGKVSLIKRVPVGVVLAFPPFNYPVNEAALKYAVAVAAGNAVVVKAPTRGSLSCLAALAYFNEAGFPPGVINAVTGRGSEIGDYLVEHSGVDLINFTGSTETGERIAKKAGMVPMIFALSGKDPAIVLEDADLKKAVKEIISGAFSYAGQRCTAVKRVIVVEKRVEELTKALITAIGETVKLGDPREDGVTMGPVDTDAAAEKFDRLLDDAVKKGATLCCGGVCSRGNRDGRFIDPTVVCGVTKKMALAWEEPFGPILPIMVVADEEEAVTLANESVYGLQASVFTESLDTAFRVADQLETGTVQVNGKPSRGPDNLPVIATKKSGMGVQGVRYGIQSMTRLKQTVLNIKTP